MTALPSMGPLPRDELAEWSDAALGPEITEAALPLSALPWPGRSVRPRSLGGAEQRVFVRTTRSASTMATSEAVYIHGLAGASPNWTPLAGLLAQQATGYAPDLPGCGRSDPPRGGDYSVAEQIRVLAALIGEIASGPVHLVGNSLGGFLATHLAAAHPRLIRSLTLISPAVPDFRLTKDRGADYRLAALLVPGLVDLIEPMMLNIPADQRVRGMVDLCFGDASGVTVDDYAAATAEYHWRTELPWTQRAVLQQLRELMKSYLSPRYPSYWRAASRVTVPVLVVWGTRDRLVDVRLAHRTVDAFSRARLLVLPGVGHVAQMEAPVPTARAMATLWSEVDGVPVPVQTPTPAVAGETAGAPIEQDSPAMAT